jgi:hypothetical protein
MSDYKNSFFWRAKKSDFEKSVKPTWILGGMGEGSCSWLQNKKCVNHTVCFIFRGQPDRFNRRWTTIDDHFGTGVFTAEARSFFSHRWNTDGTRIRREAPNFQIQGRGTFQILSSNRKGRRTSCAGHGSRSRCKWLVSRIWEMLRVEWNARSFFGHGWNTEQTRRGNFKDEAIDWLRVEG